MWWQGHVWPWSGPDDFELKKSAHLIKLFCTVGKLNFDVTGHCGWSVNITSMCSQRFYLNDWVDIGQSFTIAFTTQQDFSVFFVFLPHPLRCNVLRSPSHHVIEWWVAHSSWTHHQVHWVRVETWGFVSIFTMNKNFVTSLCSFFCSPFVCSWVLLKKKGGANRCVPKPPCDIQVTWSPCHTSNSKGS